MIAHYVVADDRGNLIGSIAPVETTTDLSLAIRFDLKRALEVVDLARFRLSGQGNAKRRGWQVRSVDRMRAVRGRRARTREQITYAPRAPLVPLRHPEEA